MIREIFVDYISKHDPENTLEEDIPALVALGAWSEEEEARFTWKARAADYRREMRMLPPDMLDARGNPIERLSVKRTTREGTRIYVYVQRTFLFKKDLDYVLNDCARKSKYFHDKHQRIFDDAMTRVNARERKRLEREHQHDFDFMRPELAGESE